MTKYGYRGLEVKRFAVLDHANQQGREGWRSLNVPELTTFANGQQVPKTARWWQETVVLLLERET